MGFTLLFDDVDAFLKPLMWMKSPLMILFQIPS